MYSPYRPQTFSCEGIVLVAILAPVLPSDGRSSIDLLHVVDGYLSPTPVVLQQPQFDDFVVPEDRGNGGHLGQVHAVVAGGGGTLIERRGSFCVPW